MAGCRAIRQGALAALLAGSVCWDAVAAGDSARLAQAGPSARGASDAIVDGVPFVIRFGGAVQGLEPGAPVQIRGIRIGAVRRVGLEYVADRNGFVVPVEIVLQPSLFPANGPRPRTADETYAATDALVRRGLRAVVAGGGLLGGEPAVELDILADTPAATLGRSGAVPEIPAGPTRREVVAERLRVLIDKLADAPVEKMVADLDASMTALRDLTTGPELRGALAELRGASGELRTLVGQVGGRAAPLLESLNETVRATNRMIDRTGQTVGTLDRQIGDRSPLLAELRVALRELGGAARSLRLMAEYLERNPGALVLGKSDDRR